VIVVIVGGARSLGYTNVVIMPDGIKGWVHAGKKTQPI
jgi:rhodanese-related sulfurtransferase